MKDERMAILSMVEKGVITVEDAERLLEAIGKSENCDAGKKISDLFTKAGDGFNLFAKTVGEKTEKVVEDAKPVVKKAGESIEKVVEDAKPVVKKAAEAVSEAVTETAENIKKVYETKVKGSDEEVKEDDFEEDVTIMPVTEEVVEEVEAAEEVEEDKE